MNYKKDIDENVRSGLVELLILKLLSERDMYGYELRTLLSDRTGGAFEVKEPSLYGPLYRMASRGLITSEKVVVGEKRFRMYYHLEDAGKEYLAYGREQIDFVFGGVLKLMNEKPKK